jgi:hypothetical protein
MELPPRPSRPTRLEPAATSLPLGRDAAAVRRRIEALEGVLERMIELPIVRRKIGLDAIAGVIPVAGDLLTAGLGLYLVWEGRNLGLSRWQQWRMLANIGFDTAIGAVPLAGDLFDLLFRSNSRNLRIIRRHLDKHFPATKVVEG